MIELKKDINTKKIPKNENPNKIADIVVKVLDFNKKQKGKGLPQMLASRSWDLAPVAKVSDRKVSNRKYIKILTAE